MTLSFTPDLDADAAAALDRLVADGVAGKIAAQDPTLWGPDAEHEASIRLRWVGLAESSRPLLAEIDALRAELAGDGLDRIVLAGMGGSSLAPEVIARSAGVELTVLDTTDPDTIGRALSDRLDRTVLVVSSKSGTTVEPDSLRRRFLAAFADAGIDGATRIVVVTDPGSPLADLAEQDGYRKVFLADPNVGGRYSALTAFGLVPAGLAGADIAGLLDDAAAIMPALAADDPANPALQLGAALGAAHAAGREKVVLGEGGQAAATGVVGFPAWTEQLIAESTGKLGKGLLPVDVDSADDAAPGWAEPSATTTRAAIGATASALPHLTTSAPLGALMLLWETAIAVAGRVIGINPFDQPDVEAAKKAARALLDDPSTGDGLPLAWTEGAVGVYAAPETLRVDESDPQNPSGPSLRWLFANLGRLAPDGGYLALQAYLDRTGADADAAQLRGLVTASTDVVTTFGWGPRFLHSTGQYHKGGHPNGAFVQITGNARRDLPIPDQPFTFGQLQLAQAAGDARVLAERGRPVVRLHLTDRAAGLAQLLAAARG